MLTIDIEREADGRWLAELPALPGVLAYGATPDDAKAKQVVKKAFGSTSLPFLKGAVGIAKGQIRQKLGLPPGHPGTA